MKKILFPFFLSLTACLLVIGFALPTSAEVYPSRPITLIVQFTAGTSTDIIARKLADEIAKVLGQPVVCVNKPGGGGTIGIAEVLRSKPDGYTIGCANMPALAIIPQMQQISYDPLKDVAHICAICPYEYAFYVKADAPWNSLKDFVDYVKANPDKVIYGSLGAGSTNHLIFARLAQEHGLKMKHVVYKGDGELIPAVLGGHVQIVSGSPAAVVPQVKAGQLKLLAITNKDRWPYLPEVPTLLELGYNFYQSSYLSLLAPAGTPEPVRKKLEDAFRQVMEDPALKKEMQEKYFTTLGFQAGKEYGQYIEEQFDYYKDFLKKEGLVK